MTSPWLVHPVVLRISVLVLVMACSSCSSPRRSAVPPPTSTEENTTLGPGDTFMMEIVGEKELPKEYQVASDGTVDVPYLHTVKVAGLEPQEVARMIRQRLMEERILNDPSVVVQVQEYRSKQITVLGQVVKPGAFSFRAGMTLVQAISQAGGLNAIALRDSVRLTRRIANGKTRTVSVDFEAISSGDEDDIVLQAGDRIFVDERVF